VPFIIQGPDIDPQVSKNPVTSMDIYPTILELAGILGKPDQHSDGVSIISGLSPDRTLYWHYPHYHGSMWTPGAAIREGRWKLIEFYDYEKVELFNLNDDLSETLDLSDSLPDITNMLLDKLHAWQKETNALYPIPNQILD